MVTPPLACPITGLPNTYGETYSYYGHPNKKGAKLYLPYQDANGTADKYTIDFDTDTNPFPSDTNWNSFKQLGQVSLDGKALYVVEGIDTVNGSVQLSGVFTSGCANSQCSFTLPNSSTYFSVSATKGVQNPVTLDDSMIPQLVSIFQSMKIGQ